MTDVKPFVQELVTWASAVLNSTWRTQQNNGVYRLVESMLSGPTVRADGDPGLVRFCSLDTNGRSYRAVLIQIDSTESFVECWAYLVIPGTVFDLRPENFHKMWFRIGAIDRIQLVSELPGVFTK
jgi:hypothetical protein